MGRPEIGQPPVAAEVVGVTAGDQDLEGVPGAAGRAGDAFEILVTCSDAYDLGGYRRLADLGATHLTTMPWLFYGADPGSLEQKLDGIARFGEDVIARM